MTLTDFQPEMLFKKLTRLIVNDLHAFPGRPPVKLTKRHLTRKTPLIINHLNTLRQSVKKIAKFSRQHIFHYIRGAIARE